MKTYNDSHPTEPIGERKTEVSISGSLEFRLMARGLTAAYAALERKPEPKTDSLISQPQ